ncbi:hypothetical protein PPM_3669 [Paenibacillus polymyxa M1]|nr:hypothetical protein PPM_3669 [Paenibacillus polymyxa M1]
MTVKRLLEKGLQPSITDKYFKRQNVKLNGFIGYMLIQM